MERIKVKIKSVEELEKIKDIYPFVSSSMFDFADRILFLEEKRVDRKYYEIDNDEWAWTSHMFDIIDETNSPSQQPPTIFVIEIKNLQYEENGCKTYDTSYEYATSEQELKEKYENITRTSAYLDIINVYSSALTKIEMG